MPRKPRTKARLKRQENALRTPQGLFDSQGRRIPGPVPRATVSASR